MERIQSALAKARAARDAAEGVRATPVEDRAAPTAAHGPAHAPAEPSVEDAALDLAPDPTAVAAAWAALREVRIDPRALERAHVVAAAGGGASATFDVMRTKLLHQVRAQGWRRIAVTSPGPGCGKSTVALNLAFGLARQSELRVALVEADLRRPVLARLLALREPEGAAEVLEGAAEPIAAMRRHRGNLAFLAATGPRRHPAELLGSPRVGVALDAIEAALDPTVTLFDLPPMMAGDDVMAFAGHVDGILLVAAAGTTTIRQIDACEREIATRTNVVGVVLNRCRYLGADQGYGKGY